MLQLPPNTRPVIICLTNCPTKRCYPQKVKLRFGIDTSPAFHPLRHCLKIKWSGEVWGMEKVKQYQCLETWVSYKFPVFWERIKVLSTVPFAAKVFDCSLLWHCSRTQKNYNRGPISSFLLYFYKERWLLRFGLICNSTDTIRLHFE